MGMRNIAERGYSPSITASVLSKEMLNVCKKSAEGG